MFASNRGFSGSGYWMTPDKFYHERPRCHGNKIWDKIGCNSACIRDIPAIFAYNRGFSGSGYWMTSDTCDVYFAHVLVEWYHHIVLTMSFKLISVLHLCQLYFNETLGGTFILMCIVSYMLRIQRKSCGRPRPIILSVGNPAYTCLMSQSRRLNFDQLLLTGSFRKRRELQFFPLVTPLSKVDLHVIFYPLRYLKNR